MLNRFIHRILEPKHFWRDVGFKELSELYTSELLRSLAISLVGVFTPLYLYSVGYSLRDIALFHVGWFMARPIMDIAVGFLVAKIGPKHTMLLANFVHVIYLSMILTIKELNWPLLLVALVGSMAYCMHLLAVSVSFSKIKHAKNGGKELGYLVAITRVGAVLGPLLGGLIASFYDPRYTIGLAMVALLISALPLFMSAEPVHINQHISFRNLPIRQRKYDFISGIPKSIELIIGIVIWPLFIGVFILGDNAFAKLGAIIALSTLSSIVLSRVIGSLIDDRKALNLLRFGAVANALLHLGRATITTPLSATVLSVASEPLTASYHMPYMKGQYDVADSLKGYRIAYLSAISAVESASRLVFWLAVWLAMYMYESKSVLVAVFIVGAVCSLGIMLERFEALRPNR